MDTETTIYRVDLSPEDRAVYEALAAIIGTNIETVLNTAVSDVAKAAAKSWKFKLARRIVAWSAR